jgi:hypothetical protein
MSARWRGIRTELRVLVAMLWDSTRPLTETEDAALRVSWEQYLTDREAFTNSIEREQVAA